MTENFSISSASLSIHSDICVFRLRLSDRKLETITDLKGLGRAGTGT